MEALIVFVVVLLVMIGLLGFSFIVSSKKTKVEEKLEVKEKPKSDIATTLCANNTKAKEAAKQEALDKLPEFFETLDKELLEYSEKNPTKTSFNLHPFIKEHGWENLLIYAGDEIIDYYRDFTFGIYSFDLNNLTKKVMMSEHAARFAFYRGDSHVLLSWGDNIC